MVARPGPRTVIFAFLDIQALRKRSRSAASPAQRHGAAEATDGVLGPTPIATPRLVASQHRRKYEK